MNYWLECISIWYGSSLAHLTEGRERLCHGAASSTFSFKRLLLKNH